MTSRSIQHEYGIYGGVDGDDVVDVIAGLRVPSIVVAHTILKDPTPHQRSVFEEVAAAADQVVVMSAAARQRLRRRLRRRSPARSPRFRTARPSRPRARPSGRFGRPTLLTWGLLGPGKGIERVIDAMGSLHDLPGRPRYLVAGRTHPKVLAAEGEAYRDGLAAQAQRKRRIRFGVLRPRLPRRGVADGALIQSAAGVVLPYDSTDQVTSGVLVDAIASGRPVVATAFPHAVELLASGAGIARRP